MRITEDLEILFTNRNSIKIITKDKEIKIKEDAWVTSVILAIAALIMFFTPTFQEAVLPTPSGHDPMWGVYLISFLLLIIILMVSGIILFGFGFVCREIWKIFTDNISIRGKDGRD